MAGDLRVGDPMGHLWMVLVSLWFWNVVPIYWLSAQLTHKPGHWTPIIMKPLQNPAGPLRQHHRLSPDCWVLQNVVEHRLLSREEDTEQEVGVRLQCTGRGV